MLFSKTAQWVPSSYAQDSFLQRPFASGVPSISRRRSKRTAKCVANSAAKIDPQSKNTGLYGKVGFPAFFLIQAKH